MANDIADLLANPPFELSDADREVLHQTDAEFVPHTWEELREVIATKDTSTLRRTPSGLANYMRWLRAVGKEWRSISTYILVARLRWAEAPTVASEEAVAPAPSSDTIFAEAADYAIRRNDWPYGCEAGIVHLVVWLKGRIRVDASGPGDPVPADAQRIDAFVAEHFARKIGAGDGAGAGAGTGADAGEGGGANGNSNGIAWVGRPAAPGQPPMEVMWFRNRTRWQSVRALEHVHVLLRNVPEAWITEWTGGQTATDTIAERWARGERTIDT